LEQGNLQQMVQELVSQLLFSLYAMATTLDTRSRNKFMCDSTFMQKICFPQLPSLPTDNSHLEMAQ